MSRTEARELLMQAVFQMEAQHNQTKEQLDLFLADKKLSVKDRLYIENTFATMCDKLAEVDELINENSKNWKVSRMPKADLAILRLAVCEAKYCDDIPAAVAVNEAVNMAKKYCGDKAPGFINGILGSIIK
ncbi:MAG: transcription antitermination factor NusB [Anaerovoracaceae bacterium]|jgi:N utilization substance protein B